MDTSVVSTNINREVDRPAYHYGNRVLLGITVANMVLVVIVKAYYTLRNKQRQRKWNAMSEEEQSRYLGAHQHNAGAGRLDFQFVS